MHSENKENRKRQRLALLTRLVKEREERAKGEGVNRTLSVGELAWVAIAIILLVWLIHIW